ncbi:hypothetical protein LWE61_12425 [Sphingobium sufflavum]|uniref:hypothetical protein n=1 Tax=Sphingobium sufflavum TaxID=1129547 RepID=UPI001F28C3E1|nr:hypothetical protein [Sphingobium sufflavum]MCE7797361.1 hypothetical protein [Sphingobium sufflavum]
MTKKKDGRPPRCLSAWRTLQAQGELVARFPAVTMLIDTLAGNFDADHVDTALANAIDSVKAAGGRSREALAACASVEERQLHAAAEVERIAQDRHALAKLAATVSAELDSATADLADAEIRLRRAMLEGNPADRYERDLVRKLRAAGVTDRLAREFNPAHVTRIKEALDGAPAPRAPRPRPMRRKADVALAWSADNRWGSVLEAAAEHYRFDRRPITSGAVDVNALRQCGLPPDTDLAAFGDPHLIGRFEAAPDARARARACWDICAKWIAENIVDDVGSGVAIMRERAWTFLFGVQHGFAHQIKKLDRVTFPSPWTLNEYVVAQPRD